MKQKLRTN